MAIEGLPEPLAAEVRALSCFFVVVRTWRYFVRVAQRAEGVAHRRAGIYAKAREKDDSIALVLAHQLEMVDLRGERDRALRMASACEALAGEIAPGVARVVEEARRYRVWLEENDPPF